MKATSVVLIRRVVKNKGRKPATYWALRWPGTDGRTRQENIGRVGVMTEKEAGAIRLEKIGGLQTGTVVRDPSRMSLAEFLDLDRESIRTDVTPATLATHATISRHALAAIGGDVRLDRVGWREVAALKAWLNHPHEIGGRVRPPCSRATIKRTIVTLKAAWNRAIARKLVIDNPFAGERLPKIQSKQKRIFTPYEVAAMVNATPSPWWKALLTLGFTTGLRLGEMLSLTWADIDGAEVIVSAKRASAIRLEWSAKSHHERRVPLCSDAVDRLHSFSDFQEPPRSPYVFIEQARLDRLLLMQTAGKLVQPSHWINNLPRDFGVIQSAAARDDPWERGTIHDLRRSYGTHMARVVSMNDLRGLMGHAAITTTADFYLGASDDLAAKVDAAFSI